LGRDCIPSNTSKRPPRFAEPAFALAAAALVLLAGCAATGAAPSASEPLAPAGATADAAVLEEPFGQLQMEFTGCIGAGTVFTFPSLLGPGRPVEGWPDAPPVPTDVELRFAKCERMRWGPFERPITLIYEIHDRQTPDPGCTSYGAPHVPGTLMALQAMWFDDAEVAAWANLTFGMPTKAAAFTVTEDAVGPASAWTWRWQLPSGEASEVTFRHADLDATKQAAPYLQRLAWRSDEGILHLLDFHESMRGDRVQATLTPGTMGPSMLYSQAAPSPYLGYGDQLDTLGLAGDLHRFEDMACATPA
jgi:hypothetical protein